VGGLDLARERSDGKEDRPDGDEDSDDVDHATTLDSPLRSAKPVHPNLIRSPWQEHIRATPVSWRLKMLTRSPCTRSVAYDSRVRQSPALCAHVLAFADEAATQR
jgi:hypothetical protein